MKLGRCESCEMLREMLDHERKRYDTIVDAYRELRVQGANPHAVGLPVASRQLKPADEAIERMVERYPHFRGLRQRLQRFVNLERQKPNADEAKLATMVTEWQTSDGEGDE